MQLNTLTLKETMAPLACQMDTEARSGDKTAGFVVKSPPIHTHVDRI